MKISELVHFRNPNNGAMSGDKENQNHNETSLAEKGNNSRFKEYSFKSSDKGPLMDEDGLDYNDKGPEKKTKKKPKTVKKIVRKFKFELI